MDCKQSYIKEHNMNKNGVYFTDLNNTIIFSIHYTVNRIKTSYLYMKRLYIF